MSSVTGRKKEASSRNDLEQSVRELRSRILLINNAGNERSGLC